MFAHEKKTALVSIVLKLFLNSASNNALLSMVYLDRASQPWRRRRGSNARTLCGLAQSVAWMKWRWHRLTVREQLVLCALNAGDEAPNLLSTIDGVRCRSSEPVPLLTTYDLNACLAVCVCVCVFRDLSGHTFKQAHLSIFSFLCVLRAIPFWNHLNGWVYSLERIFTRRLLGKCD